MAVIFVDESGDTGFKFERGSSRYLVACLVGFDTKDQYQASSQSLDQLRADWGRDADHEFHFSALNRRRKLAAIEATLAGEYWVYSFVLNKSQLWDGALRQKHHMYQKVVSWLLENAIQKIPKSELVFDKCGNRDFYAAIKQHTHNACKRASLDHPKSFVARDSRNSNGLQIADLVAGSVARLYSGKENAQEPYQLIMKRSVSHRVWPQK